MNPFLARYDRGQSFDYPVLFLVEDSLLVKYDEFTHTRKHQPIHGPTYGLKRQLFVIFHLQLIDYYCHYLQLFQFAVVLSFTNLLLTRFMIALKFNVDSITNLEKVTQNYVFGADSV